MRIAPHVYRLHIAEDPREGGVMHPGGTNIYFVGDPSDSMVLIDTGEHYRDWIARILEFHASLGSPKVPAILITHGHGDHIGGLERLQELFSQGTGVGEALPGNKTGATYRKEGCVVRCHPRLSSRLGRMLGPDIVSSCRSREAIQAGGGVSLRALFTPGHEVDHVCYYLPRERVMFSGDTILGASSSTVGDLSDYMKSLELLARYRPRTICPGHGPVVTDAGPRIAAYIEHRQARETQVLAALEKGLGTVDEIVRYVYPRNLRRGLKGPAARNVTTHLTKLKQEGRLLETPAKYVLTG